MTDTDEEFALIFDLLSRDEDGFDYVGMSVTTDSAADAAQSEEAGYSNRADAVKNTETYIELVYDEAKERSFPLNPALKSQVQKLLLPLSGEYIGMVFIGADEYEQVISSSSQSAELLTEQADELLKGA